MLCLLELTKVFPKLNIVGFKLDCLEEIFLGAVKVVQALIGQVKSVVSLGVGFDKADSFFCRLDGILVHLLLQKAVGRVETEDAQDLGSADTLLLR